MSKLKLNWCSGIDSFLEKMFRVLLILSGLFIVLSVVVQVLLRYLFKSPLFGIEELSLTMAIWAYFIGAAVGTKHDGHVQGDMARIIFKSPLMLARIRTLAWALSLIACVVFFYHAASYSVWIYNTGERTAGLWWPRITSVGSMFFGGLFMTLYSFQNVLKYSALARQTNGVHKRAVPHGH